MPSAGFSCWYASRGSGATAPLSWRCDIIPPFIHQFFPGAGRSFDGDDADPQGITNFSGLVAMGYTAGTATDNSGKTYNLGTDIRVYQGDYVGAAASGLGFASKSAKAHGTFCE